MTPSVLVSRRRLLLVGATFASASCGRRTAKVGSAGAPAEAPPPARGTLEWAAAGPWRGADAKLDATRHPLQTLGFFGLKSGTSVVEVWPGSGWYSQIIAPFLTATGGKLYAAAFQVAPTGDTAAGEVVGAYRKLIASRPDLYGAVQLSSFGPASGPLAPAAIADLVLFLATLPTWMAAGLAEKAFRDAYAVLKPTGVLGVEARRASPGGPQDPLAGNGYVQEAYVKQMAQEAGFRFDRGSEINADPKDNRRNALGDGDRMTLRFIKPT